MKLEKCFECGFKTKERFPVVPQGRKLALCNVCQKKIPDPTEIKDWDEGLGRKCYRLTREVRKQAKHLRSIGLTYAEIGFELQISLGSAHKACRSKD